MANSSRTESALGAKQLVFLVMMATVVAVIVFLCGVLVGRGVPLRGGVSAAGDALPGGINRLPLDGLEIPGDPDAEGAPLDGLSYFDRLNGEDLQPEAETAAEPEAETAAETIDEPAPADRVGAGPLQ